MEKEISVDLKALTIKPGKKIMKRSSKSQKKVPINSIIVVFITLFLQFNCYASDSYPTKINNTYVTDLNLAFSLSKDTEQDLVVIFSADWCGFCKSLKSDLPNIEGFENKIICIVDTDKENLSMKLYKVKNLPTSIYFNCLGKETDRTVGYEKKSYQIWLKSNK